VYEVLNFHTLLCLALLAGTYVHSQVPSIISALDL